MSQALFPTGTVTRRLHADPAMWFAGVTALCLQALHPRTVRGLLQNSGFRSDPVGRLMRTARFVAVTTYGSSAEAERAADRVRRRHAGLRGHDVDGTEYRLDDPELLLWVHCAATACYAEVGRRAGVPLSDADVDAYLDEQRRSAELIGLDPRDVPGDRGAMATYLRRMRPHLEAGPDADEIYLFLAAPPLPAAPALLPAISGAAWSTASALTWQQLFRVAYSALPGWAVRLYGRPAQPPAVTTAALRVLCGSARLLPRGPRAALVGL